MVENENEIINRFQSPTKCHNYPSYKYLKTITKNGGVASFFKADTYIAADNETLVKATVKKYGKLNIACNNAGIAGEANPTGDYSPESWKKVIDINLNGVH